MKFLLALDFDHTIIDEDSDNAVLSLNPSLLEQAKTRSKGIVWCDLMNELVQVLQIEHTPAQITERLAEVPIETQMYTSLEYAYEAGTEIIIISDSNTFYIDQIMEKKDFKRFIRRVITNNGVIGENGKLSITRHTLDNDCVNLCRQELRKHVAQYGPYDCIIYAGDGRNDYCAGMQLRPCDVLMPRLGFALASILQEERFADKIASQIMYWSNASEFHQAIKKLIC